MFSDNMPGYKPPTHQEKIEYFNNQIKKKDKKIEQLEAENKRLKDAMQTFVDRCDKGEVRSTRTYNQFKELLGVNNGR